MKKNGFVVLSKLKIASLLAFILIYCVNSALALTDEDKQNLSLELASTLRAARAVVSDNQALINDEAKGDKGLTPAKVVASTKENFKKATGQDLPAPEGDPLVVEARGAIISAIEEVMTQAQPLINQQGKGFKGFLPAVFAKQVADTFNSKVGAKISMKLTAPKDYVRNRANRPDEWEEGVIENKFKNASYEKGKAYAEAAPYKGKPAYRLIIPEYYGESCLKCHGDPKGATDITGGKMEGGKLGELGGAISVAIL